MESTAFGIVELSNRYLFSAVFPIYFVLRKCKLNSTCFLKNFILAVRNDLPEGWVKKLLHSVLQSLKMKV